MLNVGDFIPEFKLQDQNGNWVQVNGKHPNKRLIYFYPKDETFHCTKQACSINNNWDEIVNAKVDVFGISADNTISHKQFESKYNLKFTLLSDLKNNVRKSFGAQQLFGLIPLRVSYLVNEEGMIIYAFSSILAGEKHVEKVLEEIRKIS